MKNSYITLAVLSMAAFLVSCQNREFNGDMYIPEKGDIVFALPNKVATKAPEATVKGATIDLGVVEGSNLFLEETITNLDEAVYVGPQTKGTPAYTENIGVLYANNLGVHADKGNFGENVYTNVDGDLVDGGWRFNYKYGVDPWPTDGSAVGFYLRMPATMSATEGEGEGAKTVGVTTDLTVAAPYSNGAITFNYVSPSKAEDMRDILFGYRSVAKSDYPDFLPNGIPVLLRHALTGVKFAIANYDAEKAITIKSVAFKGLYDSAECTITPVQGTEANNPDDIDEFTSAAAAVWNLTGASRSQAKYSSGDFGAPVNYATGGSFGSNGKYPASFAGAGNQNNLNKADGSQTFWLIPQAVTSDVKLEITYTFGKDNSGQAIERTETLEFGRVLTENNHSTVWHAGELHTYTIRVDEVNVKIADNVAPTAAANTPLTDLNGNPVYKEDGVTQYTYTKYGGTKTNVVITNTGNTDAYIRAALIGQWLDEDGNPVFGFTDYTAGRVELVDSWYQDQFVTKAPATKPARKHGTFTGLVGYDEDYEGDWVIGNDGYYYYKILVPAGASIPSTDPLFTKYEVGMNPAVVVAGKVKDVYFTLEISTQAVTAKKPDGSDFTWNKAWENALQYDPSSN